MRRDVLAKVEPRRPSLGDHAYAVLTVLAAPAPFIVRAAVALVLVGTLAAGATVASADALPEEPLYGVKIASEQLRLALARTPEDRAAVWLSMAEHRLGEAERLAIAGREPEALVATSAYGTQLAEAAAELAAIERLESYGPSVVARLKARLDHHQQRAADVAERLRTGSASARSAPAFDTVASAPPAEASGSLSEQIAEHAASVTDQVAAVAEQRAQDEAVAPATAPAAPPAAPAAAPAAAPPAAAPAARPQRPAPAARQPAAAPASTPQGVGNVTVPDPTPANAAAATSEPAREGERRPEATGTTAQPKAEEARGSEEKAGQPSEFGKQLTDIQKRFEKAIDQIKQKQKEAREALNKAKERGKKTPSPAPARSKSAEGASERGGDERDEYDD